VRVEIRHYFEGAELGLVERLYMLDHAFNEQTFAALGYGRRVVEQTMQGDRLARTLHLCPTAALPAPFSKLLRDGAFYIREHVEYDFVQHRGSWATSPSVLTSQFQASGSLSFARDARGVAFHLEGAARSTIPLLARSAEKQAVRTAEEQHAALAGAVRARLLRAA
jgi:hypothetical protein